MIKISIYQNNKKILGGITNIEENKVKEIADAEISSLVPTIKKNMLICPNGKSPKEFAIENSSKSQVVEFVQWGGTHSDSVAQYVTYKFIRGTDTNWGTLVAIINDTNYRRTIKYCGYDGYREDGAKWGDWINVNTTKVADVAETTITTLSSYVTSGKIYYQVKNGVCYVSIIALVIGTDAATNFILCSGLPKCASKPHHIITDGSANITSGFLGLVYLSANGELGINLNRAGTGYCSFSYPVAES